MLPFASSGGLGVHCWSKLNSLRRVAAWAHQRWYRLSYHLPVGSTGQKQWQGEGRKKNCWRWRNTRPLEAGGRHWWWWPPCSLVWFCVFVVCTPSKPYPPWRWYHPSCHVPVGSKGWQQQWGGGRKKNRWWWRNTNPLELVRKHWWWWRLCSPVWFGVFVVCIPSNRTKSRVNLVHEVRTSHVDTSPPPVTKTVNPTINQKTQNIIPSIWRPGRRIWKTVTADGVQGIEQAISTSFLSSEGAATKSHVKLCRK